MPATSIIGCQFWELIGCLSKTFGGVPVSNVADSLDGTYLGRSRACKAKLQKFFPECHNGLINKYSFVCLSALHLLLVHLMLLASSCVNMTIRLETAAADPRGEKSTSQIEKRLPFYGASGLAKRRSFWSVGDKSRCLLHYHNISF